MEKGLDGFYHATDENQVRELILGAQRHARIVGISTTALMRWQKLLKFQRPIERRVIADPWIEPERTGEISRGGAAPPGRRSKKRPNVASDITT